MLINKNNFVGKVASSVAAMILCCASFSSFGQKPNVLVFLIDDLRDELGCYDSKLVKSPNIDNLAKDGVQFDKAYCQQAICAPSRMSILTGLRPETIGIHDIFTTLRSVHPNMTTMPQLFKNNGYKTVSIGKVYHHGRDDQSSWTTYIGKEENVYVKKASLDLIASGKNGPAWEDGDVDDEVYKDGRAARDAITTLQQVKNDPFLMVVGFSKPHLPFNAPKRYWDLYDRNDIVVPSRSKPENMYINALTTWGELRGYGNIPAEGDLNDFQTKSLIHGYYACVSYVDAQVGRVMRELERLNLRKNTMVVFMSDHGYKIGEYGSWNKHSNMELDAKVPLILSRETSYKGRATGIRSDALVENVDIFPTIIEACGLPSPNLDGKSILCLLDQPNKTWDDAAYNVYPKGNIMGVSVTDGSWRYTEWRDKNTQQVRFAELYDHKISQVADANLAGRTAHRATETRMKGLLEKQFPPNRPPFEDQTPINNRPINQPSAALLSITAPSYGMKVEVGKAINITASILELGTKVTKVNFRINGTFYAQSASAPFTVQWTPDKTGQVSIDAIGLDDDNKRFTSCDILVEVIPAVVSNVPPTVTIISPSNNATFEVGQEITLQAGATDVDGNLEKVNFLINNDFYRTVIMRPFETTFIPTAPGIYRIAARAFDKENLQAEEFVSITVIEKNLPPTGSFTTPTALTLEEEYPLLIVTVNASDPNGDNINVALKINGVDIRTETVAPYEWGHVGSPNPAETVGLKVGNHLFQAVITDEKGAATTISRNITVTKKVVTSVSTTLNKEGITVFPNPSTSGLFNFSAVLDFELFDAKGLRLMTGRGDQVDLSRFEKGIYYLRVENDTVKLVVQ